MQKFVIKVRRRATSLRIQNTFLLGKIHFQFHFVGDMLIPYQADIAAYNLARACQIPIVEKDTEI
jgi:hypothetical protein